MAVVDGMHDIGVGRPENGYPNGYPSSLGLAVDGSSVAVVVATNQRKKNTGSIYQNSRGQWVGAIEAGWTARGIRRRLTLKAQTEKDVRTRLAEAQRRIAADSTVVSFASISLKRWADEWIGQRQHTVRPGTFVSDRSAVDRWIVPTIGHLALDALAPSDIRRVASAQENAGLALPTMRRTHAVLGRLLKDAVSEGFQVSQRARETGRPGAGLSPRQAISTGDAQRILAAVANRPDASRWGAALIAGLRPAEALGLTWGMVDMDAATMTLAWQLKALPYAEPRSRASGPRVPRGFESRHLVGAHHLVRPKTHAGFRVVPMVPWLADTFATWRQCGPSSPFDLVWPRDDGFPRSAESDRAQWYDIVDQLDVKVTLADGTRRRPLLYEARHTAATLLLKNGIDATTIKAVLGHSTMLSTQTYLHADRTRTRAALAKSAKNLGLGG